MLNRYLTLVLLVLMSACGTDIKPEQISRVKQNFDKIKPGMTEVEVEKLVGKPYKGGIITYNVSNLHKDIPNKPMLECKQAPCSWDVWALPADVTDDFSDWPIVVFDLKTSRVIKVFRGELEQYFPI
jgi:hypothetical protein